MVTPAIRHIVFNSEQSTRLEVPKKPTGTFRHLRRRNRRRRPDIQLSSARRDRQLEYALLAKNCVHVGFSEADLVGSVRLVALLERTNIIALVSGEPRQKFSPNTGNMKPKMLPTERLQVQ